MREVRNLYLSKQLLTKFDFSPTRICFTKFAPPRVGRAQPSASFREGAPCRLALQLDRPPGSALT